MALRRPRSSTTSPGSLRRKPANGWRWAHGRSLLCLRRRPRNRLLRSLLKKRILVLGAGFGGLELCTMLSEAFGDGVDVTLIDKSDSFYFGFSKLDVMFGHTTPDAVKLPYKKVVKPGVRVLQETISSIDPVAKRVTTDRGTHEADFMVVALGADYDFDVTPGMVEATEFYTLAGAT